MESKVEIDLKNLFWNINKAASTRELWNLFVDFCKSYRFLMVRISIFPLDSRIGPQQFQFVEKWDITRPEPGWADYYLSQRMYEYDQSIHMIRKLGLAYMKWSDMKKRLAKGSKARSVFEAMPAFGIGEGALVAHSSLITRHTAFLGMAGPGNMFSVFTPDEYRVFMNCAHTALTRMVNLAAVEGRIEALYFPEFELSWRENEVLTDICNGFTARAIAIKDKKTDRSVNQIIRGLKDRSGTATTASLIAWLFRSHNFK